MLAMRGYESWGRYPRTQPAGIVPVSWASEPPALDTYSEPVLAYGMGRSYGDCCLNDKGWLVETRGLNRFISFDDQTGVLRCEAGVTLKEILDLFVPRGWFLPVTPGTKIVTVGGAIANDIHGKNHHRAGTFGCHVTRFELFRSNGQRLVCSPQENQEFFRATIGGLGLTGLILWAELRLRKVSGPFIDVEQIRFRGLKEFFELTALSDRDYEYTVAWVDCLASGKQRGRGLFMRGNHGDSVTDSGSQSGKRPFLGIPFDMPSFLINRLTMRAFNTAYFYAGLRERKRAKVHYDAFFYPLDVVRNWNRLYGRRGFLQYQCVVSPLNERSAMEEILERVLRSRLVCGLAVLKQFGSVRSPGMLSFPRHGTTLAMDFPVEGEATFRLCEELDDIVRRNSGAVYLAKDARVSRNSFRIFYPQWHDFSRFVDPHFSSSLWRRVAGDAPE